MLSFINLLSPYYMYIKFAHVIFVMMWAWSAVQAFTHYLIPAFSAWRQRPDDENAIKRRNWAIERFDDGVLFEHIAFPIVIITGLLLYVLGGWSTSANWLLLKLAIIVVLMIPIEIADYYLAHFGGNKARIRIAGDMQRYENMIQWHWLFFLITTPIIMLFATTIIFLAVVKPF